LTQLLFLAEVIYFIKIQYRYILFIGHHFSVVLSRTHRTVTDDCTVGKQRGAIGRYSYSEETVSGNHHSNQSSACK